MKNLELSTRVWLFCGFLFASLLFAWHPLLATFQLAIKNDEYTHILLIIPVSLAFILVEWRLVSSMAQTEIFRGLLLLCAAATFAILIRLAWLEMPADLGLSAAMLALVTWWIGGFILIFGARVTRSLVFPLAFLYCVVPLPTLALDKIVNCLQQGSAFTAWLFFAAAGVPVSQDGLMVSIPGLTVEVAKECSSIRSSLMLLVTTLVLAQLFLRSPLRKALIVAIAMPLSVAKNGLRIFTIAMLGTRVDPAFLTGRLHRQGGIVFFVVALLLVLLVLRLLERRETQPVSAPHLKALASC
ncbi:MAG TPA: exosortase/archaeosortase family protein [Terriglobales bacterium]|nr:exosortase/archaeosortase family protein [Terriglobales bacterium]